jgi:hypothetical protein
VIIQVRNGPILPVSKWPMFFPTCRHAMGTAAMVSGKSKGWKALRTSCTRPFRSCTKFRKQGGKSRVASLVALGVPARTERALFAKEFVPMCFFIHALRVPHDGILAFHSVAKRRTAMASTNLQLRRQARHRAAEPLPANAQWNNSKPRED